MKTMKKSYFSQFGSSYYLCLALSVVVCFGILGCQQQPPKQKAMIKTASTVSEQEQLIGNEPFMHVVYFWLARPDHADDRAAFEAALASFLESSAYAKNTFIGTPPKATRSVVDDTFTYNLIVSFESAEAQENYQKEAAHLAFIEKASHLWKKVTVYDAIDAMP